MEFYAARPQRLCAHVVLLPQHESPSGGTGRPLNSYAVETPAGVVLFDAGLPGQDAAAREIAGDAGVVALVLSHADVVAQADQLGALAQSLNAPLFLHPADQQDPRVRKSGLDFADPMQAGQLSEAGIDVLHIPGHSPGSIMLYDPRDGGVMLTGDSAVLPGPEQDGEPDLLERPKMSDENDRIFAERWRKIAGRYPLRSLLPLHGQPLLQRDDLSDDLKGPIAQMLERPPMDPAG